MSEKSKIDAVLSVAFNECSIVAADAAKSALEIFESGQPKRDERYVVGRYLAEYKEPFDLVEVANGSIDDPRIADGKVTYVLARHPHLKDMPTSLMIAFNDNRILLPIGSFESRHNGQCSYVQIGQEIDEDKLVVTPGATRTEQVEAIRSLLRDKTPSHQIESIVKAELDEYAHEIEEVLVPVAVETAMSYFESTETNDQTLLVMNSLGVPEKVCIKAAPISYIGDGLQDNLVAGHRVQLFLGKRVDPTPTTEEPKRRRLRPKTTLADEQTDYSLGLYARLRGDISIKLASFLGGKDTKPWVYLREIDELPDLELLTSFISVFKTPDSERESQLVTKFYLAIPSAEAIEIVSLPDRYDTGYSEKAYDIRYPEPKIDDEPELILPHELAYFEFSRFSSWSEYKHRLLAVDQNDYPRGFYKDYVKALDSNVDDSIMRMVAGVHLADILKQQFDQGNSAHEALIQQGLGHVASEATVELDAVLNDHAVGKTTTSVLAHIKLTRRDDQLRVMVEGRPAALEGFDLATLFDVSLDLTGKNSTTVAESDVQEIMGVLKAATDA